MICPLVGNQKIKQSLENSILQKRIPHALLIEGDTGTGRHTLANYIAMATVCGEENAPCGICKNCLRVLSGNHPDIEVIQPEDGKKTISVSIIRELKAETYVKPHMAKKRVFIIDKADTLSDISQNTLLKILEEPPESVAFILIAQTKASFLETIISRCVILTLTAPEKSTAREYLLEKTNFGESEIDEALKNSSNNIGKAIEFLEGKNDTASSLAAKDFINSMLSGDLWGMLSASAIAEKNRLEAQSFFKDLKYHTAVIIRKDSKSFKAKKLSLLYSKICELEKNLDSNINLSLLCCLLVSESAEI